MVNYDAANLLIILDNSRNMRRTLELVRLFDSDTFAGQRVRPFDNQVRPALRSGQRASIDVFKAYALAGDKGNAAIHFLPIDRINTILAVSANPGVFTEVEKWIEKLDIPAKVTAGSIDNYVYKLRYARAEVMGSGSNLSFMAARGTHLARACTAASPETPVTPRRTSPARARERA